MHEDTIYDLFYASLSGMASDQQRISLIEMLENDPDIRQEYVDYVVMYTQLYRRKGANVIFGQEQEEYNSVDNVILDLSRQEQEALPVEIEKTKEQEPAAKIVELPSKPKKTIFSKTYNVLISAVAVFMFAFIVYTELYPAKYCESVATVVGQVGAKWDVDSEGLNNEDRVYTSQAPFRLIKGTIELAYDDGVDVIIEGPAKFTIEKKGIDLVYGRVYSYVSMPGRGFAITTCNSRYVDLGTEFGVQADARGVSELHVLKGEVQLFIGQENNSKLSQIITENNAVKYNANSNVVSQIPVQKHSFVREVNSENGLQWRGLSLDLADIVGGGNGFGTGNDDNGINFKDGKISFVEAESHAFRVPGYVLVKHPFIDGVFVPDGRKGAVRVSSSGITYSQFPDTKGECYASVCNNSVIKQGFDETAKFGNLLLPGEELMSKLPPRICLHSNAGITFDLAAIRGSLTNNSIRCLTTSFGLIDMGGTEQTDVDIFILVDGKTKYSHKGYLSGDKPLDIEIELNESDRFITLVCTEGARNYKDWPLFISPVLKLE